MPNYVCTNCGAKSYSAAPNKLEPCEVCGGAVTQDKPHKPTQAELEDIYGCDPAHGHDFGCCAFGRYEKGKLHFTDFKVGPKVGTESCNLCEPEPCKIKKGEE
jgi:rRNA maturation protein Nop10